MPTDLGAGGIQVLWRLRHNTAGEPAIGGVVDGESGLHAGETLVAGGKRVESEAKLVRLRPVLGVEHGNEGAARKRQRGVQSLGLGARTVVRRDNDLEGRTELQPI